LDIDTITLYHGTTHDFSEIDVTRGKAFKDFGPGFYATANLEHAERLALRNRRIEHERLAKIGDDRKLSAYIYTYELDLKRLHALKCRRFDTADKDWLRFVILNRTSGVRRHDCDVVIGPTANDNTRTSIRAVTNAANGNILSDAALDLLLVLLEPENLPAQYYFGSARAVKLLKFQRKRVTE
jgi:hypothetical protein